MVAWLLLAVALVALVALVVAAASAAVVAAKNRTRRRSPPSSEFDTWCAHAQLDDLLLFATAVTGDS